MQRICPCKSVLLRVAATATLVLLVLQPHLLRAQTVTGTILGNVLDASGSAVPIAEITVTNQDTGVVRSATASDTGVYNIPSLLAGKYTVAAKAQGFSPAQVNDVVVNVGSETRADLRLQVGSTTQTVTVTESVPTVETTASDVSQVMDQDLIKDIPLNARDLQQLASIQPSVQFNYTSSFGKQLSIGGDRVANNRFLQEGIDMTWTFRTSPVSLASNVLMGADAVKEFKVITENPPAEYGELSGGVISTTFKSGTNSLHGTVFEYYRNSVFDARNFFDGPKIAPLQRHQFGGSVGGPIQKDKTFFFTNYEGFHADTGYSFTAGVPDAAARGTGNGFGQVPTGPGGSLVTVPVSPAIYRIFFGGYGPDNGVPLLPNCNGPEVRNPTTGFATGLCQFLSNPISSVRENYGVAKIDHSFGSKNTLSGTYNMDVSTQATAGPTTATADDIYYRRQTGSVQDTHILSTNVVNTFRFGVNRINYQGFLDLNGGTAAIAKVDPELFVPPNPFIVDKSPFPQVPSISVPGMNNIGTPALSSFNYVPRFIGYTMGNITDDINWQKGKHSFQFGFQVKKWYDNIENYMSTPRGTYTFPTLAAFLSGTGASSFSWWVNNYTDPLNGQTYTSTFARGMRLMAYGTYAEDTYKFKPNLTVTVGVRWEYETSPQEEHNRIANFYGPGDPPSCTPNTCTGPTVGAPWYHPSRDNFAPRLGFNWDPFKKGTTSVRAGAGVFFNEKADDYWYAGLASQFPFTRSVSLNGATAGGVPGIPFINVGTPASGKGSNTALNTFLASPLPTPGGSAQSPFFKTPTKYGYNLAIQQELPQHISVLIAYVGSQGRHLGRTYTYSEYAPTTIAVPGQLPAVNGVPIPGSVINPSCTIAGSEACYYWAGAGLNNANLLGNVVGAGPGGSNGLATAATAPYATLCGPNAANGGTNRFNCFNNPNWSAAIGGQVEDATSQYNSLQTSVERRMSPGLLVRGNYTFAKCIAEAGDNQPGQYSTGGGGGGPVVTQPAGNRGNCTYVSTHAVNLTITYDAPFGRMVNSAFAKAVVGGWQITSQTVIQSGVFFTISQGEDTGRTTASLNGGGSERPNWAAPNAQCPNPTPRGAVNPGNPINYINSACFALAPLGYIGNVGALVFTGPGLASTDVSLRKTIPLRREGMSFVFSADMFNAFNRTNFSPPGGLTIFTTTGAVQAGVGAIGLNTPYPTITTSRQFQINGRFNF